MPVAVPAGGSVCAWWEGGGETSLIYSAHSHLKTRESAAATVPDALLITKSKDRILNGSFTAAGCLFGLLRYDAICLVYLGVVLNLGHFDDLST